jgi:hypothetical protein
MCVQGRVQLEYVIIDGGSMLKLILDIGLYILMVGTVFSCLRIRPN